MSILEVHPSKSLDRFVPAWENLAKNAIEPNAFFEPWAFIPAWKHLASTEERCLFIFSDADPTVLLGFIPITSHPAYRGLPIRHLGVWRHLHCFLGTPLIRRGAVETVLKQLFSWVDEFGRGYLGFEFPYLYADGALASELRVFGVSEHRGVDGFDQFDRAFLFPGEKPETYLERALKKKHRKDLEKKMESLQQSGPVELRVLGVHDDGEDWNNVFLTLERSGWKGAGGTALAASHRGTEFFKDLMRNGASNGALIRQLMTVGDRPICARVSLRSGTEALSFKIAFDEKWGRYSPGMLLEIANLRWVLSQEEPLPMDSCAAPGSEMFRRLWLDSKRIESLFISKSSGVSRTLSKGITLSIAAARRVKQLCRSEAA